MERHSFGLAAVRKQIIELDRESTVLSVTWDENQLDSFSFEFRGTGLNALFFEGDKETSTTADENELQSGEETALGPDQPTQLEPVIGVHRGRMIGLQDSQFKQPRIILEALLLHPNLKPLREFEPNDLGIEWELAEGVACVVEELWDSIRLAHIDSRLIKNKDVWDWVKSRTVPMPLDSRPLRDRCLPAKENLISYKRLDGRRMKGEQTGSEVVYIGDWDASPVADHDESEMNVYADPQEVILEPIVEAELTTPQAQAGDEVLKANEPSSTELDLELEILDDAKHSQTLMPAEPESLQSNRAKAEDSIESATTVEDTLASSEESTDESGGIQFVDSDTPRYRRFR